MNLGNTQNNNAEKYPAIPDGNYPVQVFEITEGKPSKNGNSVYTEFTLKIADGEFKDRRVWERSFESGVSSKAIDVSRQRLEKLVTAAAGKDTYEKIMNGQMTLEEGLKGKSLAVELATKNGYTNVKSFLAS